MRSLAVLYQVSEIQDELHTNSKSQFRVVLSQVLNIHMTSGHHTGQQNTERYASDTREMIPGKRNQDARKEDDKVSNKHVCVCSVIHSCVHVHLCPLLCSLDYSLAVSNMDCSPPGSSVHGIFLARILEWVAISSSSSKHMGKPHIQRTLNV